jgi:D-alanyl-D-alanine dipeptidase
MKENRVTVKYYGRLPSDSPLLVPIATAPGHPQQRLHKLATAALAILSAAVQKDLGFPLLIASGWRPHRWTSREQYEAVLIQKYGSVAKGRIYLAFDSPHETGLAMDIGVGGLSPNSATIPQQKQTALYKWLDKNESLYGFTDYSPEPWHKEFHISLNAYKTGIPDAVPATENVTPAAPATSEINDVCEDNTCMESPLFSSVLHP